MTGSDAQPPEPTVRMLYCRCAFAQVVPADVKSAVLEGLAAAGRGFEGVADLCDMAARRDPHLADLAGLAKAGTTLRIAACWPRAVRGLFHLADSPLGETGVEILNMRTLPAERVLAGMLECRSPRRRHRGAGRRQQDRGPRQAAPDHPPGRDAMTTLAPRQPRVVLYEGSGAEPFAGAERAELDAALLDRGYSVTLAHEGAAAAAA